MVTPVALTEKEDFIENNNPQTTNTVNDMIQTRTEQNEAPLLKHSLEETEEVEEVMTQVAIEMSLMNLTNSPSEDQTILTVESEPFTLVRRINESKKNELIFVNHSKTYFQQLEQWFQKSDNPNVKNLIYKSMKENGIFNVTIWTTKEDHSEKLFDFYFKFVSENKIVDRFQLSAYCLMKKMKICFYYQPETDSNMIKRRYIHFTEEFDQMKDCEAKFVLINQDGDFEELSID